MFRMKEYKNACDELRLSTETLEEMIDMIENQNQKLRRPSTRLVLVAAALVAALGITASAAEIPAVQQFFAKVFVTVKTDDNLLAGLEIPTMVVEERDGRTILLLDEEETDITEALARDGEYLYRGEGYEVRVDASGEAWLTAYGSDGDVVITMSTKAGMKDETVTYNVATEGEEVKTGLYEVSTDGSGSLEVTDIEGTTWNYKMENGQPVFAPEE